MATAYYNFGACVPQTSTGASNAFEVLGICQKGGRIQLSTKMRPIFTDLGGPEEPSEFQQMGQSARITLPIIAPDTAVLSKVYKRSVANGAGAEGTPGTPGSLMGTGANCFSLYIPSGNVNPWVFTSCFLEEPEKVEGTEAEPFNLVFRAWRFIPGSASSVSGATLYTRTAPS